MDEAACRALENAKSGLPGQIGHLQGEVVHALANLFYHAAKAINEERTTIGNYPVESLVQMGYDVAALVPAGHEGCEFVGPTHSMLEEAVHLLASTKTMEKKVTDVPASERLQWPEQNQREATMLRSRAKNCQKLAEKVTDTSYDISSVISKAQKVTETASSLARQSGNMTLDAISKSLQGSEGGGVKGKSWREELPRNVSFKDAVTAAKKAGIIEGEVSLDLHTKFHRAQEDRTMGALST